MKQLIINLLLFILPLVILVYILPIDRRQNYIQLKEDCSWRGIWVYDRVHYNIHPMDIVFFGSSRTINGIIDEAIEERLNRPSVNVVNFGYCRYGMNLYPVLLKEILQTKNPKDIFLEIREDENRYSHPIFPYVANAGDIFLATPFFNRDLIRDDFDSFLFRLKVLKNRYFRNDTIVSFRTSDFGYMGTRDTVSRAYLDKIKLDHKKQQPGLSPSSRNFYMTYPRIYLKELAKICSRNHIRLNFIYLPEYYSNIHEPLELQTYKKYGNILIPPRSIFEDPNNWGDEVHLNKSGAKKLSEWIADQILLDSLLVSKKPPLTPTN